MTWTSVSSTPGCLLSTALQGADRMWKKDSERVLAEAILRALDDAVAVAAGCVETLELGHRYGHLSPLVNVA
jgi:hypothetical protein